MCIRDRFGPDPDIKPGEYYIKFGIPNTFLITSMDTGNDALDSDADPATGETAIFLVLSREQNSDMDCGYYVAPPENCDGVPAQSCGNADVICKLELLNEFCTQMESTWDNTPIPDCPPGPGGIFHNPSWLSLIHI